MNADGTQRMRLSPPGSRNWHPLWSPDGKSLAFLSDMNGGKLNLFAFQKGVSGFRQLTFYADMTLPSPQSLKPPFSWSPKGDEIAYIYRRQLWKVGLSGYSGVSLAAVDPAYAIVAVDWSRGAQADYVAYLVRKGRESHGLWLVNPRLLDKTQLAEIDLPVSDIAWSPDGLRVAYQAGASSIFTVSPKSSVPQPVIQNANPRLDSLLGFSPNAAASLLVLAQKAATDKGYRVGMVRQSSKSASDTGALDFLTEAGVDYAAWSPDGSKIVYTQRGDLWAMNPDGKGKTRLAATGVAFPSWGKK